LGYLVGPIFQGRRRQWVEVGPVEGLGGDEPRGVRIQYAALSGYSEARKAQVVWISGSGDALRAHSSVCPHFGCNVIWKGEAGEFFCPCHGARFGRDGAKIEGPQRGPLRELNVKIEDGRLFVEV
jgi:menaquinol-cytochrome c reductase iron-sulfur subunit